MTNEQQCQPDLLSAYVDGELDDGELGNVTVHLGRCERCRNQLEALEAVKGLVTEIPSRPPSPEFASAFAARLRGELAGEGKSGVARLRGWEVLRLGAKAAVVALAIVGLWWGSGTLVRELAYAPPESTGPPPPRPVVAQGPTGDLREATSLAVDREDDLTTNEVDLVEEPLLEPSAPSLATKEEETTVAKGSSGERPRETGPQPDQEKKDSSKLAEAPAIGTVEEKVAVAPGRGDDKDARRPIDPKQVRQWTRQLTSKDRAIQEQGLFELAQAAADGSGEASRVVVESLTYRHSGVWPEALHAACSFPTVEFIKAAAFHAPTDAAQLWTEWMRIDDRALWAQVLADEELVSGGGASGLVLEVAMRKNVDGAGVVLAGWSQETSRLPAEVRARFARLARWCHDESVRDLLAQAMRDRNESVRIAAVRSIGARRQGEELAWLRPVVVKDSGRFVRASAARALAYDDPDQVEVLLSQVAASDKEPLVRAHASLSWEQLHGLGAFTKHAPELDGATRARARPGPEATLFGVPIGGRLVCVLVDVSASMGHDGKHERVAREVRDAIALLPAQTKVVVVSFGYVTQVLSGAKPQHASPALAEHIQRRLLATKPQGKTRLLNAMGVAMKKGAGGQVVVVSDGADTSGVGAADVVFGVRKLNRKGNWSIHTCGVFRGTGDLHAPPEGLPLAAPAELLRQLAAEHGGIFVRN